VESITSRPDCITLVTDDFSGPSVSESFKAQLRSYDPTLCVMWNSKKMRFVVQQCVEHHAPGGEHTHLCQRIYVLLAQASDGTMLPLGDTVMNAIRARDVTKAGYGPTDLQRWIGDRNNEETKVREKIDRDQTDAVKHASRFNRRQLLSAFNKLNMMGTPNR